MREIKFRAWDEIGKCWCEGKGYTYYINKDGQITFPEGGWDINGEVSLPAEQNIVLMQYTGLKDKNGKEIYEGDIVQSYPGIIHKVVYREDIASFVLRKNVGASLQITFDDGNLEVIGNIYENPELLKP